MRFGGGQNILVQVKQEGLEGGAMGAVLKQYGNSTGAKEDSDVNAQKMG